MISETLPCANPPHGLARRTVLTAAAAMLAHPLVRAQSASPIRIVVPSPAGSAPDLVARILADQLQSRLQRPTVVDNRPGAGGIVAVMASKSQKADGTTLLLAQAAVATITPLTYRAAKYDMQRDFEPIAVAAETPFLVVTRAQGPATLADAIAQARAKPGTVTLGSTSRGSTTHLTAELLTQLSGAPFTTVPMANSGQAIQAVVSGDTLISVDGTPPLLPLVRSGRLRALASTASRVLPGLEDIPLAKDTVPGLVTSGWFMLFAPKGTPSALVQQYNQIVTEAMQSTAVVTRLQGMAAYPAPGSVADARAFLAREVQQLGAAVHRAGLRPE